MLVKDKNCKNGSRIRIIHNVKCHFTGTIKFLEKLKEFLFTIGLPVVKINTCPKNPLIGMLEYSGRKNLKKLYDFMYKDCQNLYLKRKKEKFEEIFCALSEKSLSELGLIAGTPETVISSQATNVEGSSTIPEMEVESSDSKCPTLSK